MNNDLLMLIAGAVAPLLIQAIKFVYLKLTGSEMPGVGALWVTYLVAFVFALGARLIAGEIVIPPGTPDVVALAIGTMFVQVLGAATVVYKSLIKPPV